LRPFFGKLLWKVEDAGKKIYLTFDDGPIPEVTPRVLDILDDFGWKATFFCVGENVKKYPELYDEILKRGHRTGNHSFNHLKGWNYNAEEYVQNVQKASEYIQSDLFRPPYGRITKKQAFIIRNVYKFKVVMWDVITYDYSKKQSTVQILKILRKNLRKGSIVVFHDSIKSEENVLNSLPKALEFWKSAGYSYGIL
jgi:peptidoglycan/xylan/chitin deacetylase (PgdA/CDA1 family)